MLNMFVYQSFELLLTEGARFEMNRFALWVEQNAERQGAQAVVEPLHQVDAIVATEQDRVADTVLVLKVADLLFIIDGDTDYLEAPVCVSLTQMHKERNFFYTGWAPCGPEVNQQQLAIPFIERLHAAAQIRQDQFFKSYVCRRSIRLIV